MRVHFQVVGWTVLSNDMLQANEWGWKMADNSLCPVMTDLDACLLACNACRGQSRNNTDMTMNLDVDDDDHHDDEDAEGNMDV